MTIDQVRAAYQAHPFRPFTMHLADGREVPVHHRDFIMASPSGRTVSVYHRDDTLRIVDLLLVTEIEFKRNNGMQKRRNA